MIICQERGADLHMAQLMPLPLTVSCFSKIQIGFTFLVPADLGSPRQRAVKRVCVCVWVIPPGMKVGVVGFCQQEQWHDQSDLGPGLRAVCCGCYYSNWNDTPLSQDAWQKILKPPSEPTSPSGSRTSTPQPPVMANEVGDDDDEPDSEGEREELNWPETPTGSKTLANSF